MRVGNSVDPADAFRNFMGRDPDASALVARSIDSAARGLRRADAFAAFLSVFLERPLLKSITSTQ